MKKNDQSNEIFPLADIQIVINSFLENNSKNSGAGSVQITKLKKEVKKWKNSSNKLSTENKKLEKEIKKHEEYYDRFDILDF